jgi:hypothetical protein
MDKCEVMLLDEAYAIQTASNSPPLVLSISVFPLASFSQTPCTHLGCRPAAHPNPPSQHLSQTQASVSVLGTLHSFNHKTDFFNHRHDKLQ